jgi:hypothetical protein
MMKETELAEGVLGPRVQSSLSLILLGTSWKRDAQQQYRLVVDVPLPATEVLAGQAEGEE